MPHLPPGILTITNTTDKAASLDIRGGLAEQLAIHADIVHIASPKALGLFRGPDGVDRAIGDDRYCARKGGCACPDGTDPGFPQIGPGTGYLGVANYRQVSYLQVGGESLDQFCKDQKQRSLGNGIVVGQGGSMGGIVVVARFTSGECRVGRGGFTATAADRGFRLAVHIGAFSGFTTTYTLHYSRSDPGFVVHGVGGPFSNVYRPPQINPAGGVIRFYPGGARLILGFLNTFNPGAGEDRIIFGNMQCRYPRPRK
jgi:hypothetical protein